MSIAYSGSAPQPGFGPVYDHPSTAAKNGDRGVGLSSQFDHVLLADVPSGAVSSHRRSKRTNFHTDQEGRKGNGNGNNQPTRKRLPALAE